MNETPKDKKGWRMLRRILIGLAILATLIAIFYTEEDWRGKRAWDNCKRELEAKGAVLDWDKFIPPPVPDDQNFFKAPKMQEWFVKHPNATTNELNTLVTNASKIATITDKTTAAYFLAWSDQFQPVFDSLREALKRPYARMDGDYAKPYEIPIPHFVNVRAVAQALAQRSKCDLLLGQRDKALNELALLNDSRRLMERTPTGQPMTLVDAMVNVAITGLYVNTIAEGLRSQVWQEPQLVALQEQLKEINLTPFVAQAFECEPAATCRTLETADLQKITLVSSVSGSSRSFWQKVSDLNYNKYALVPRGWVYQNMALIASLGGQRAEGFDPTNNQILPGKFEDLMRKVNTVVFNRPYNFLAVIAIPNLTKATQTLAHNQTLVNESQIVCALERYRLSHGEYPETLDALVPQFIEKLPHDIIGGQPLHYRRTEGGKFLLYSVGWNETDDDGQVGLKPDGSGDLEKGDWVWKN
jgi:hypothetical protein